MNFEQRLPSVLSSQGFLSRRSRRHGIAKVIVAGVLVFLLVLFALWFAEGSNPEALPLDLKAFYVGRQSCVECHQKENHLFLESHHHQALAKATKETVLANFDNQSLQHDGIESRFTTKDGRFYVTTESPEGKLAEFEVKYVLAYHPLQQYMVQLKPSGGRVQEETTGNESSSLVAEDAKDGIGQLQVLRLSWDVEKKKWFYLRPEDVPEKIQPEDPLHWSGVTQRWNTACAACHSTDLKKHFNTDSGEFSTTFSDIDVSCESCHGPGSVHVQIAKTRNDMNDPNHGSGLFSYKNGKASDQIDSCAPCHSRRRQLAEDFHKTRKLHDVMIHEPIRQLTYYPDGQIKDEDYVYGSFIQSKMFANGIRCTDCHNPHSGKTHFSDNRLCTSCHSHPQKVYDSPSHHGHKAGGPGSLCVNCHMPHRTYMAVDARRDHSIRIPRPDLSLKLLVPNACTGCHLEKQNVPEKIRGKLNRYQDWLTLRESGNKEVAKELGRVDQWAEDHVTAWRTKQNKAPYPIHFGEKIKKVWDLELTSDSAETIDEARKELLKIANGAADSPMYRMTAASEMAGWNDQASLDTARKLLKDKDPAVVFHSISRVEAEIFRLWDYRSYRESDLTTAQFIKRMARELIPLLSASTRLVRTRAATVIANLPPAIQAEILVGETSRNYNNAVDEAIKVYELNEQLGALGDLYQSIGRFGKAEQMYRKELKFRPNSYGARTSIAVLLEQQASEVMFQWRKSINQMPAAQQQKATEEANKKRVKLMTEAQQLRNQDFELLEKDIQRGGHLESSGGIHYRYAMALYVKGKVEDAGKHLKIACKLDPNNEGNWLALATFFKAKKDWAQVVSSCEKLIKLDPNHPGYLALLKEAKQKQAEQ